MTNHARPADPSQPTLKMTRPLLALLLFTSLACNALTPHAGTPTPSLRDSAEPAPAYTGQYDCYGNENGLQAYAGRITVQTGGQVTFKDYDGVLHTGAWSYDAPGKTFTFTGGIALASAIYKEAEDSLVVVLVPNAAVAHADSGMRCQRAVPGQTGPPL
jgi:hypothetical protein